MQNPSILEKIPTEQAVVATDCKSLFDLISKTAAPSCSEFRTVLQAKLIKEHLGTGVLLRWVPSGAQLADSLTKIMDNTVLREILKLGTYKLNDEQEMLNHRADIRTRVKWLRENSQEKPSRDDKEVSLSLGKTFELLPTCQRLLGKLSFCCRLTTSSNMLDQ